MVMPGKGEMYSKTNLDIILNEYDKWKDKYKETIGLKAPN